MDGVCCHIACGGGNTTDCVACSIAAGAANDGICGPAANGTSCDDSDACTQTDACQLGVCAGSNPVVCTPLDQCHDGICDPLTGLCSDPSKPNGTSCTDFDACTQTDTCESGACTGADPVACTASDECHDVGSCVPETGACDDPELPAGTPCSNGVCQSGVCEGTGGTGGSTDADSSWGCRVPGGGGKPSPWGAIGLLGLGLIWARRRNAGHRRGM